MTTASEVGDGWVDERKHARFEICRPHVVDELMGDEFVVINFDTGKYHGIRGIGVDVWRLLDAGYALDETVAWCTRQYSEVGAGSAGAIARFVLELEQQALIALRNPNAPAPVLEVAARVESPRFALPVLDTRDDLQDYLTLDPIHDVDERGWPNARG